MLSKIAIEDRLVLLEADGRFFVVGPGDGAFDLESRVGLCVQWDFTDQHRQHKKDFGRTLKRGVHGSILPHWRADAKNFFRRRDRCASKWAIDGGRS